MYNLQKKHNKTTTTKQTNKYDHTKNKILRVNISLNTLCINIILISLAE